MRHNFIEPLEIPGLTLFAKWISLLITMDFSSAAPETDIGFFRAAAHAISTKDLMAVITEIHNIIIHSAIGAGIVVNGGHNANLQIGVSSLIKQNKGRSQHKRS
jgi:hypothetical protein